MKIFDLTQNFLRLTLKDINANCPSNDEYKLCDKTIGEDLFNCIIGKSHLNQRSSSGQRLHVKISDFFLELKCIVTSGKLYFRNLLN